MLDFSQSADTYEEAEKGLEREASRRVLPEHTQPLADQERLARKGDGVVNWIDIVIIAVVLWFTLTAFHAGFIRETMTMIAAVLGVVVAGLFYKDIASAVFVFPDNETVANIVAFGTIFGAVVLAGQLMAMLLKPAVHAFQLGVFDQLAGAGFGFLKAMVFVEVFLIVCITFPRGGVPQDIHNSMFGGLIVDRTASVVVKILPSEFKTAVDEFNGTL